LDVAIEVFSRIKKKVSSARLLVVGEFRDPLRIGRLLQKKGLQDSVSLLGYCADVRPYYEKAAVHLFTSVVEAAPMVLAELAAYGVPTVMLELPMCWDATRDNGVVQIGNDDLDQMADECVRIVTDAVYAASLSAGARNWFASKRGVDVGAQWQDLFEKRTGACATLSVPCSYKTEKNYDILLKEVVRAERFFITRYWRRLGLFMAMERRWLRIRRLFIDD
jgi:glycosyltransferase involved in cell wall biosynthesis